MRILSSILIVFLFINTSIGQDIIYLKNNEQIKAKVTVIDKNIIWYKKFDHLNGPEYKLNKSKIAIIVYQNGRSEQFNLLTPIDSSQNNIISFNVGAMPILGMGMSYTRYLLNKKMSLKIPVSGFLISSYSLPKYSTGLDINVSVLDIKKTSYYFGIGSRVGRFKFDLDSYGYPYSSFNKKYWGVYFNNGFSVISGNNFIFSTQIGFGFRNIVNYSSSPVPSVIGEVNLGIFF